MKKISPLSRARSVLLGAVVLPCITAGLALSCRVPGQEASVTTRAQDNALAARVAHFEQLVAHAEQLARAGDHAATRAACRDALAAAQLDRATPAWIEVAESALWRLGFPAYEMGDLRVAHDAWEAVHRHREASVPDEHPDLQNARANLALAKRALGDLRGALALDEKVLAVRSLALPDDHPDLQKARNNLAVIRRALGDLPGARALQEQVLAARSRTLPDDHTAVQTARGNLANTRFALGDLPGALELNEKVLEVFSRTLPDDHPHLQIARGNLANTKSALGDLRGALALKEQVLAVRSRTLPDDHPDLQAARESLAVTKCSLGDLAGALSLQQQVLAVYSQILPDDHPDLQRARGNLAGTKFDRGDLHGALALFQEVLAVRSRTLPDDHPDLQMARGNLANCMSAFGDLPGALKLQEQVLAMRSKALPDEHPDLQLARSNLAHTRCALGDLPGALALDEKVFAVWSKSLPDYHPDLQVARGNLAVMRAALGDLSGALALEEEVLAVRSKILPDDHPDLQRARGNLALTKKVLGDLPGALALEEKVLAMRTQTLPDDHPDLQRARSNLALTRADLGDLPGALALQDQVLAVRSKTLPDDHPDMQKARANAALSNRALGNLRVAAQLNRSGVAGSLRLLSSFVTSTRDVAVLARETSTPLSYCNSLLDLGDRLPVEIAAGLRHDAMHLLEAARSADLHTARLRHVVQARHPEAFANLAPQLAAASRALEDALVLPPEVRTAPDGRTVARDDAIREATFAKDAVERELLALVPAEMRLAIPPAELAARLDDREAGVSFLTYTRSTNDAEKPWIVASEPRYGAFVLTRDGGIQWQSLAPVATVDALIAAVRRDAEAGVAFSTRSDALIPGRDPESKPAASLARPLTELRALLFDPILASLPEGTNALALSLADELHLLPLDELPLASGTSLGDAFDLRTVWSLRVLLHARRERTTTPTALVLGGADYDAKPDTEAPVVPTAATPIGEPITATAMRTNPGAHAFTPLAGTKTEAEQLTATFVRAFADGTATTLLAAGASEAAFVAHAAGKTFVHLATHGYFAPESAWAATDRRDDGPLARFDVGRDSRGAQLSPYSLAGIALAGANLPADALGRREGILTAQEIVHLDLQHCELATLSACKTSLGVRRAGTGLASVRQAFHAAGARFVLATLWEVSDAEATKLMADFYDRLWQKGEEPRAALRAAKAAAKARGAEFRDWAGWALSGR